MYKFDREAYDRRMEWYRDARFGMFIHWGLYAIPARGEWVRSTEQIPKEDYMKYFEEFNPVEMCIRDSPDAGDGSADFRDGLPGGSRRRKVCQHLYFGHRKRLSGGDAAKAESRGRYFRAWKAYRN